MQLLRPALRRCASSMASKLSIDQVALSGRRVLARVDFNVPIKEGRITNTQRIDEAVPTIKHALDAGAKSVVLMSHLGRPDGAASAKFSMAPCVPVLAQRLGPTQPAQGVKAQRLHARSQTCIHVQQGSGHGLAIAHRQQQAAGALKLPPQRNLSRCQRGSWCGG
jgi:hypothetical protein